MNDSIGCEQEQRRTAEPGVLMTRALTKATRLDRRWITAADEVNEQGNSFSSADGPEKSTSEEGASLKQQQRNRAVPSPTDQAKTQERDKDNRTGKRERKKEAHHG
ncbi:hypothetical protein CDD80_5850 [Ophiocordyceps camponoti-rufipedis]|uniref:Uncharacterized protein n=1 Tax=Ophiocordyceps camponoti-rufipedis TaxID=2004952 RepID=A0A2C5ZDA3_9HYPO|nr:hypothetical protein CDD80_5850 [Ophiocordyceps camponoti-rufipedis]